VVKQLGLKTIGLARVHHVNGECDTTVHLVNLGLPNDVGLQFLQVTKGELSGFDVLVGMDVIGSGDFAVSSNGGKTMFSFRMPSQGEIDFVEMPDNPQIIGRNSLCPCGSGKKYKKCHMGQPLPEPKPTA
jgi:SEC-C motif